MWSARTKKIRILVKFILTTSNIPAHIWTYQNFWVLVKFILTTSNIPAHIWTYQNFWVLVKFILTISNIPAHIWMYQNFWVLVKFILTIPKYSSSNVPKFLSSREIYPYIKIFQLMCPLCIEKSSDKGEISLQSATFWYWRPEA